MDHRPVKSNSKRKSFSSETTFNTDLIEIEKIALALHTLCEQLHRAMSKSGVQGKTVQIKLRFSDFSTFSRSKTYSDYVNTLELLQKTAMALILDAWDGESAIRLIGVGLSKLSTETDSEQLQFDF